MIVLTARADELARVRVFDRGGDDVVAKPFSYPELRGRIRALLRRAHEPRPQAVSRVGALAVNHLTREVRVGGRPVSLAAKEFALLQALIADPTRVYTREELLREVWGMNREARTRTLDSHAFRLRRKLAAAEPGRPWVITVWGIGYRLCNQRGETVSAPDQITDLYRELARHRVEEAIDRLGRTPPERMVAQSAEALEEAAGALACMTALYATPGGHLDRRWQQEINDLIAAAASLEQLADFGRHRTTDGKQDQRGEN